MTLYYILDEAGWARAIFSHGDQSRKIVASYLSDPLADMVEATISLLQGSTLVRFSFLDEPGEHRCVVTRTGDLGVQIRVLWYVDWQDLPDEHGKEVFTCCCSVTQFCDEVLSCLQRVLDEHGIEGYKRRWLDSDFPSESFDRLRTLVCENHKQQASA